jgi:hypothetical protein
MAYAVRWQAKFKRGTVYSIACLGAQGRRVLACPTRTAPQMGDGRRAAGYVLRGCGLDLSSVRGLELGTALHSQAQARLYRPQERGLRVVAVHSYVVSAGHSRPASGPCIRSRDSGE